MMTEFTEFMYKDSIRNKTVNFLISDVAKISRVTSEMVAWV